jgi:hypothetical protein
MKRAVFLSTILLSLGFCCSWGGFVKSLSKISTTERSVSADEFLTSMFREPTVSPPEIRNFQGTKTESPGFITYYLRYNADKDFILDLVASMPSSPSEDVRSDTICQNSLPAISEKEFLPSDFNEINDLGYWKIDEIKQKEYYTCLKVPWSHTMLFDQDSDTIYHVVSEIQGY